MEIALIIIKLIVSLSLLNVWLVQYNKPTRWRGGKAQTIRQEFEAYGLPSWMLYLVGFIKVGLSLLLIASIWFLELGDPAAIGLALMLTGSIIMHIKIKDPLLKSFPAALFLVLCLVIYYF
ncbi:MAG: hypothetical protein ACI836_001012 [Saprospiraceae bacterium]|jgi:hypothetical protein|uniref:DoxX family protein n=1 Tax=Patiriisocius sp. Uisw_047 TaxID=3230969 RepID=UPI0039EA86BE